MDLKIKDEQLTKLQALVNQISQTQMELGQVESRKFDLIAAIPAFRKELEVFQKELEEDYMDFAMLNEKGIFNKAFRWIQNTF